MNKFSSRELGGALVAGLLHRQEMRGGFGKDTWFLITTSGLGLYFGVFRSCQHAWRTARKDLLLRGQGLVPRPHKRPEGVTVHDIVGIEDAAAHGVEHDVGEVVGGGRTGPTPV